MHTIWRSQNPEIFAGKIYNIGGGAEKAISVWVEFIPILENLLNHKITPAWGDWRPGDQKIYISDIRRINRELKWKPKVGVKQGIQILVRWVESNKGLFEK